MSLVIDKLVQLSDDRAKRLAELAASRGTSEYGLIEARLDLLFRETSYDHIRRVDGDTLRQLEAELGPVKSSSVVLVRTEDATFVVGTPIDPERT